MKILFCSGQETFYMPTRTKMPKRWAYLVEIATYFYKAGHDVKILDCLDSKISHAEIIQDTIVNKYDYICFLARPETLRGLQKLCKIIKVVSSKTKLVVYGDIVNLLPSFVKRYIADADFIVDKNNWEQRIEEIINTKNTDNCCFADWELADLSANFYNKELYLETNNGELTIFVSRECPFNCKFCLAVKTFGIKEKRKKPEVIVDYVAENLGFVKSFKFFSPTFTYDEEWVKELCGLIIERKIKVEWSCTSRPQCLQNEETIKLMAKAGCKKIAVGIETLNKTASKHISKNQEKDYEENIENMFKYANTAGIEIKPLLMIGIEGQTEKAINNEIKLLKNLGAKSVRITAYSPRHIINEEEGDEIILKKIEAMDKMTFMASDIPNMTYNQFLEIIYESNK